METVKEVPLISWGFIVYPSIRWPCHHRIMPQSTLICSHFFWVVRNFYHLFIGEQDVARSVLWGCFGTFIDRQSVWCAKWLILCSVERAIHEEIWLPPVHHEPGNLSWKSKFMFEHYLVYHIRPFPPAHFFTIWCRGPITMNLLYAWSMGSSRSYRLGQRH